MKVSDKIKAGELKLFISLYAPTQSGDEITGETLIAAQIPAAKRSLPGASREETEAGREVARQFAVFTIRYRPGIDTAKFLTFAGDRWDIDFVDDINGTHKKIEITARLAR
jgi:SPP1 family predicted phage head-tail adaptor